MHYSGVWDQHRFTYESVYARNPCKTCLNESEVYPGPDIQPVIILHASYLRNFSGDNKKAWRDITNTSSWSSNSKKCFRTFLLNTFHVCWLVFTDFCFVYLPRICQIPLRWFFNCISSATWANCWLMQLRILDSASKLT